MKTVVINPNGTVYEKEINGYEEMNDTVGGYLECIPLGDTGDYIYLNEEGKLLDLPFNMTGTRICYDFKVGLKLDDFIVGVMIVLGGPDDEGNETDISETTRLRLLKDYGHD